MSGSKKNKSPFFAALAPLREKLPQRKGVAKAGSMATEARKAIAEPPDPRTDQELLAEAMAGVKPLDRELVERHRPKPRLDKHFSLSREPEDPRFLFLDEEDAEVLGALQGMVEGVVPLDFTASDEFVEGRASDCSLQSLARLRRGEFAVQAHLDLHGHNQHEAKLAIRAFFREAISRSYRCVLLIPGRGLRSPGGKSVLKEKIVIWLVRGGLSRYVSAFSSACAHDGGVGAIYVLLRRRPRAPASKDESARA